MYGPVIEVDDFIPSCFDIEIDISKGDNFGTTFPEPIKEAVPSSLVCSIASSKLRRNNEKNGRLKEDINKYGILDIYIKTKKWNLKGSKHLGLQGEWVLNLRKLNID